MSRLKEINDEIYRRWKYDGENFIDLAMEYERYPSALETMIRRRDWAERHMPNPLLQRDRRRDADIVARHDRGESYTSIAKLYGISRGRARGLALREYFERGIKLLRDFDEELIVRKDGL